MYGKPRSSRRCSTIAKELEKTHPKMDAEEIRELVEVRLKETQNQQSRAGGQGEHTKIELISRRQWRSAGISCFQFQAEVYQKWQGGHF